MALFWAGYVANRRYTGSDDLHLVSVHTFRVSPPPVSLWVIFTIAQPSRQQVRAVRESAGLWVVSFFLMVAALLFLALLASTCLLYRYGWWLSPVPIMAGMLIDSLVSRWLEDSEPLEPPRPLDDSNDESNTPPRGRVIKSLSWVFDPELWNADKCAASWVTVKRLVWLGVLGMAALYLCH